jgi:hypothetical protein
VSGSRGSNLADRKALLATRAEFDRARVMFNVYEIKAILAPATEDDRVARLRPAAAMLAGLAGSFAGRARVVRWLRIASLALAAIRIARDWRGRSGRTGTREDGRTAR